MRRKCRKIVGIVIHIVTIADLAGTPMASPVMRYHAIAMIQKEHYLCIPVIR
jgi:hypothetical protein